MLTKKEQLFPQLVFHLDAVQVRGNLKALQYILAKQNAVMLGHIQQLDCKDICRSLEFLARHAKGGWLPLVVPPLHHRCKRLQGCEGSVTQNAEKIQVGESGTEVAGDGGSEEDYAFDVRATGFASALHKLNGFIFRHHVASSLLPAAAGSAATGTAAAKTPEATAPTATPASATKTASTTKTAKPAAAVATSASEHAREKYPEKKTAQRGNKNDQQNHQDQQNAPQGQSSFGLTHWRRGSARASTSQLDAGIGCDYVRYAGGDEQQGLAVVAAAHHRRRLALEAAHFPVGQDRLETIAHFDSSAPIVN